MPDEDRKWAAHQALVQGVLTGAGQADPALRARAFGNEGLAAPLDALVSKVATAPTQVTDADFAAVTAAGYSEDQLFELVICAAVGQSARLYEAGRAALAQAVAEERPDDAT